MAPLFKFFNKNKKPLPKTVRYYEDEEPRFSLKEYIKTHIFTCTIIGAVCLLIVVLLIVISIRSGKNPLSDMKTAMDKNIDSGSFAFTLTADFDGERYMTYNGNLNINAGRQELSLYYDAEYKDYIYSNVAYAKSGNAYTGNYYSGQWTVSDAYDDAVDLFEFIRTSRKSGEWAAPLLRLLNMSSTFSSDAFQSSFDKVYRNLLSQIETGVNYSEKVDGDKTVRTFTPSMNDVFDILDENLGPAFSRATDYNVFKEKVSINAENLRSSTCIISYSLDKNDYLTDFSLSVATNGKSYDIAVSMSDFSKTEVTIPEGFFAAANITPEGTK